MGLFRKTHETNKQQLYRSRSLICKSAYAVSEWKRQVVIKQTPFLSTVLLCSKFKLENIYSGVNFAGKMFTLIFICVNLLLRITGKIAKIRTHKKFEKRIIPGPSDLVWNTNMAAVSLFWNTDVADVTHRWKRSVVFRRFLLPHSRSHDNQIAWSLEQTNHNS